MFHTVSPIAHQWIFSPVKPLIPCETTSKAPGVQEDKSLHDEILTGLRDHIVEGKILDGSRVPERELCELLEVSRTPLREALKVPSII
jgi:DNA-binding GntR family transcriptional regulator